MNDMIPRISFRNIDDCEYVAELLLVEARKVMIRHEDIFKIVHEIPSQMRPLVQVQMGVGSTPRDLHQFITRHNEHLVKLSSVLIAVIREMRRLRKENGITDKNDEMYDRQFEKAVATFQKLNEY